MLLETLLFLVAAAAPREPPPALARPAALLIEAQAPAQAPAYAPQSRSVDNWRIESAFALDLSPGAVLGWAFGREPDTPRCVKLNNYWCIKKAGWAGEIAADADGHVAFASAREGAAVAAQLLRRYYVEYHRRSAREIAARWAPAQCSLIAAPLTRLPPAPRPIAPPRPMLASRTPAPPGFKIGRMLPQRVAPMGLAPHGIENTLRARWLAAHGRGGLLRRRAPAVVADMLPTPTIMAGVSEPPRKPAPAKPDLRAHADPAALPPARPFADCGAEAARVANYAARIAEHVAAGPDADLKLFSPDGQPTENLAKVLANMAAVEIGPLRAREALIAAAVAQLRQTATPPQAAR